MLNKIIRASFLCFTIASSLSAAKLIVTDDQIDLQEKTYHNCISFSQAYDRAFRSIYEDNSDEESLLNLLMERFPDKEQAQQEIDRIMNEESTVFTLMNVLHDSPPRGEKIEKNWIFSLKVEGYDHMFYIIVSRCESVLYNYGFN